jgi:acyl-coenzyme A synthetase/AMP-(fatty) acid ligase
MSSSSLEVKPRRAALTDAQTTLASWCDMPRDAHVAWYAGAPVTRLEFARHVSALRTQLRASGAMINLCEERYRFLVAYAAALCSRQTVLLPASRAEQVLSEIESSHHGSYRCDDALVMAAIERAPQVSSVAVENVLAEIIPADHQAMIGFTSGSTGLPKRNVKFWRAVSGSNASNAAVIRDRLPVHQGTPWIVATVPPQHMYGIELTVLLPLVGGMAVHSGRPLFPADVARALADVPGPRVLVSTPMHLRMLLESEQTYPATELIVSATAPLDAALAAAVEARFGGVLLEMFGSTETCVFAARRTAVDRDWRLYDGVELVAAEEGTMVHAPWFAEPTLLQDRLEMTGPSEFAVRGRSNDMIEVAGKRASLADLTRRLLAVPGVQDAVIFQPGGDEVVGTVRRLAALAVAPGLSSKEVLTALAASVDQAFLPRPLVLVDQLPRNELGKLPRAQLLQALKRDS